MWLFQRFAPACVQKIDRLSFENKKRTLFLLKSGALCNIILYNLAIQKIVDEIFFRNHERSSDFQAANSMLMDSSDDGSLAFETE